MNATSKSTATIILLAASIALTACSNNPSQDDDGKITETRLDNVEVLDGTINDDMVDLDSSVKSEEAQ